MRREGLDGNEINWEELMGKRLFKGVLLAFVGKKL